ncbi:hypothetical protein [Shinella zoogloeoides]
MVTENTTPNRGYQEPAVGNTLEVDVGRLIAALRAIDTDMASAFAAIVAKAGLNSPAFVGTPTAPTAAPGTDSGQLATTAFVRAALAALVGMAPEALDTIEELAAASESNSDLIDLLEAAVALKADAAATTAALAGKEDLLSAATSDNTLDDTDEVVYLTGTTRKRGTFSGLVSSIFKTARTIANAQFAAASFKLFNAAAKALTIDATALTADRKITMPNADIDLGVLAGIGSTGEITLSSTAVDITGIPASARKLTLGFSNVTLSAAGQPILLLGTAGGLVTTGYLTAAGGQAASASQATGLTTAIPVGYNAASAGPFYGGIEFQRIGLSNAWSYHGKVTTSAGGLSNDVGGIILSGALSQMRLTTVAGTPTFTGKVSLDWR